MGQLSQHSDVKKQLQHTADRLLFRALKIDPQGPELALAVSCAAMEFKTARQH